MNLQINKKIAFFVLGAVLLIAGLGIGVYLSRQTQNTQQLAAEPTACVENQATCAWDPVVGATSYSYQITDVQSGSQIANGTVNGTFEVNFIITPGREYKCSVSAVSICGIGPAGEATATCIAPTGVPTVAPSNTPSPIPPTAIPTATPTSAPSASPNPTQPVSPTTPPTVCPAPTKVTNIRIICPNCSTN